MTTGIYKFSSLIVKKLLSGLVLVFSLSSIVRTQSYAHLSFDSTLQLINAISSDLEKLLTYSNGIAIAASFKTVFSSSTDVFFNSLALYLHFLKPLLFTTSLLKSNA